MGACEDEETKRLKTQLWCRWDARIKQEIKDSRVAVTQRIAAAINGIPKSERPRVLVNSSAVGFYGVSGDDALNEDSRTGSDYLAQVCREWEAAASDADTRVVILRTGIVLSKAGGALAKMIPIFSMFGGPISCTLRSFCSGRCHVEHECTAVAGLLHHANSLVTYLVAVDVADA